MSSSSVIAMLAKCAMNSRSAGVAISTEPVSVPVGIGISPEGLRRTVVFYKEERIRSKVSTAKSSECLTSLRKSTSKTKYQEENMGTGKPWMMWF